VLRRRAALSCALLALAAAAAVLCAVRLRIESGFDAMLSAAVAQAATQLPSKFAERTDIAILVEGDVLSAASLERLSGLQRDLEALRVAPAGDPRSGASRSDAPPLSLDSVDSLVNARAVAAVDGQIELTSVLTPGVRGGAATIDIDALQAAARLPLLDGERRHAALYLSAPMLDDEQSMRLCLAIEALLAKWRSPDLRLSALGVPVLKTELTVLLMRDMQRLFAIGLLCCFGILVFTFRHPLGVVGPLLVIFGSTLGTFAIMALCGVSVTIVMLYLPAFLTCVSIGDAVHIQSAYRSARAAGLSREDGIASAVESTGRPVIFTALTTCAGLLGLCAAHTQAVRELGIFASVGIALAMALSLVVVPIALSLHRGSSFGRNASGTGDDAVARALTRVSAFAGPAHVRGRARANWLFIGMGAAVLLGAAGSARLQVHHDTLGWLPRGNALRSAVASFDAHLGGVVPMQLLVVPDAPSGVRDVAFVRDLSRLRDHLLAYRDAQGEPLVTHALSILDPLEAARAASNGGAGQALARSQNELNDLFVLIELLDPATLRRFSTLDGGQTVIDLQLRWQHASAYEPFLRYAETGARAIFGQRARVRLMGSGYEMVAVQSTLLRDLVNSFGAAFLLEAAVLALFLRDLRLGLIAMIPNLLPVLLVLGFMGFAGIPVDIHTLLLASIALAVVADDTAHFMYCVRRSFADSGDIEAALSHTFQHAGWSILVNGATLTAGFGVYLAASMQSMQRVAILTMLTIALALAADLLFTPALVRRWVPARGGAHGSSRDD
jgi:predicted RND superfamily exporter protein